MKSIKLISTTLLLLLSSSLFAGQVNINSADAKTIAENLKGIGIKRAEAIVEYRNDHGKFQSVNDLTNIRGIGAKTIEKNLSDILLSKNK